MRINRKILMNLIGEFDLLDELNLNFGKGQSFNLSDGLRGVGLKEGWDLRMLTTQKKRINMGHEQQKGQLVVNPGEHRDVGSLQSALR